MIETQRAVDKTNIRSHALAARGRYLWVPDSKGEKSHIRNMSEWFCLGSTKGAVPWFLFHKRTRRSTPATGIFGGSSTIYAPKLVIRCVLIATRVLLAWRRSGAGPREYTGHPEPMISVFADC
jgi:hypothetical protein